LEKNKALNGTITIKLKINNMAVDLRCPDCGDNFGKDKENPTIVYCECGYKIHNPAGHDDDEDDDEDED